jgi:hypothetical protein
MKRFLLVAILALLTVVLFGCLDPIVSDMQAEHEQLGKVCQQQLQQGSYPSARTAQPQTLFPAQ